MSQVQKSQLDALAFPTGRPPKISHFSRAQARSRFISISEGKVIAELTFLFWKRLYGPEYNQALWITTLKRTFPNKKIDRGEVATHLEQIYQSRNRLAHHEPVLHKRFDDTIDSIEFVVRNLHATTTSANTPLTNLLDTDIAEVKRRATNLHGRLDAYRSK
jgi:hypothetical protein